MVNDPFKALSHPIRRGIVERLAAGPATVGDATRGFGVSKPAITMWVGVLKERLHAGGIDETEAADLGSLLVTTLEGAHVLARAEGSIDPFDQAARALSALVASRYPG